MNKKDAERLKKKVQKVEKLITEYNEKITKELSDINSLIDSGGSSEGSKVSRRRTPRRSSGGNGPITEGTLLSEND